MRSFCALLAIVTCAGPSFGQATAHRTLAGGTAADAAVASTGQSAAGLSLFERAGPGFLVCGTDFTSIEARLAHEAIKLARKNGSLERARKSATEYAIGDKRNFNIIDAYGTSEEKWAPKSFRLVDKLTDTYYLWIDEDEYGTNSYVTPNDVAVIRRFLSMETPVGSVNPTQGIIQNNEEYFGPPPDIDQDGYTDILVYGLTGTGGFVTPIDFIPTAPDSIGNRADVVHVSSRMDARDIASVIGHEYTHAVNLTYDWDWDYTFNVEGYATYSQLMNGFLDHRPDYLRYTDTNSDGKQEHEYSFPLFGWRFSPDYGGPDARDYGRGGHFFAYIASQHGPTAVGGMLRGQLKGPIGIDSVLVEVGSSLHTVLRDFHTANLVNDVNLDTRFGYTLPDRKDLRADLSGNPATGAPYAGARIINGENKYATEEGPDYYYELDKQTIRQGAAHYIRWDNVADISVTIDPDGYQNIPDPVARENTRIFQQGNLLVRAFGVRPDGSKEVYDLEAAASPRRFNGRYASLTLIISHDHIYQGRYLFSSYWTPLSQAATAVEAVELPASAILMQNYPNPFNPQTVIPFELTRPEHVRLSVHDLLGRRVALLSDRPLGPGRYEMVFDATGLSSGVYFYRLQTDSALETKSMQILR